MAKTSRAAQACTGGFTSPKSHSYAGSAPLGCWNHSRHTSSSWYLANAGSTCAERDAVEAEVPRGEPRVLPLVRHRHDVERLEVAPAGVAALEARGGRGGLGRVAGQPAGHVVVVELLAPEHPRERLAHDAGLVVGRRWRASSRRRTRRPPAAAAPRPRRTVRPNAALSPEAGPAGRSLSRSSTVAPAATSTWYQTDALVPTPSGFTVASPDTTWSLMPSLGKGSACSAPNRRASLVWFSQNSGVGAVPSGAASASSSSGPRNGWSISMRPPAPRRSSGFGGVEVPATRCCGTTRWGARAAWPRRDRRW